MSSTLAGLAAAAPWPPAILATIVATIFFAAFLRGFTGFGFAIASVPLLSLFMRPAEAVPIVLWLQLYAGIVDLRHLARLAHWRSLRWLAVGAVLGTPVGTVALYLVSADLARVGIAVFSGLAVVLLASGLSFRQEPGRPATVAVGVAAGLSNGLAAMPGPAVVAFYMALPFRHEIVRASLIMFFTMTAAIALAGAAAVHLTRWSDAALALVLLPVMWAGTALGGRTVTRSAGHLHRTVSMAVLALIAAAAGWKGLSGLL